MAKTSWAKDWTVEVRVWVARRGRAVLGEGRAELLAEIGRHRSITKAARAAGMSYRKAWTLIQEVNSAAGESLVQAAVGGVTGGGAELTERGIFALAVYEQLRRTLHEAAAGALQKAVHPESDTGSCLHLAAAISLQEALGELLAIYALRKPSVRIRAVFGASNELADHVLSGADCDVFISAERGEIDRLASAKLIVRSSRRIVATNGLAAIGLPGSRRLKTIRDLAVGAVSHVALAEPACPLGRYSENYLRSVGAYESLLPKALFVNNSRAVLSAVTSGAAEVGLAFASDAARSDGCQTLLRVEASKVGAKYVGAVMSRTSQKNASTEFWEFLGSSEAQRCFRRRGFQTSAR